MGYHTGEQLRGARAMLGWEQSELAQRANVSIKTIKRLEATTGRIEAHSEWSVVHALELGGIEFVGDHEWRDRNDGVRFAKDRTGKLRRKIVETASGWLAATLKTKTDSDPEFLDRPTEDIVNAVVEEMRQGIRLGVQETLNRPKEA